MKFKDISILILCCAWLALMSAMTSCVDDIQPPYTDFTVSGEEVTATLSVSLPEMTVKSRAAHSEQQLNEVRSLWIRTYSATTGKATSDWLKSSPGTYDTEMTPEGKRTFDLRTKSGSSYVVAVANVENPAVTKDNPSLDDAKALSELLDAADTWADFMNIAVVTPSTLDDVNAAPVPITMVGCLSNITVGDIDAHPALSEWGSHYNFQPVFIPATSNKTYKLAGAIHLRRLVSHITFTIKAGDKVNITPTSYTVVNAPVATWLYERAGATANFGDDCTQENASAYYATTPIFTSQFISEENGEYKFDFWQGENKHTALPADELKKLGIEFKADDPRFNYDKRELEKKGADGKNTGLYLCLTGETWTPNNMASYVIVRCDVEYKDKIPVDGGESVTRVGNAEYVIHLGFLDKDATDFNCYRNVDYHYNMTVNGVNDIYVEAYGDEQIPGVEGVVSDVEKPTVFLDSHYCAFNIQLTKDELTGKNLTNGRGMGYLISVWDNGREQIFSDDNAVADDDRKYVDWVELRPTTSANTLAKYYPRTHASEGSKTFTLEDASKANTWADDDVRFSDSEYYTVFVNEYVYEDDSDEGVTGDGTPEWVRYVNQNPRRFFIRVTKEVSADGQSIYTRSKYAASQASIQTYYSTENLTPATVKNGVALSRGTAIGMESVNELEGLNLRFNFPHAGLSDVNGRWNVWQWVQSKSGQWANFVTETEPQTVPSVASANLQNGPELPGGTFAMPRLVDLGYTFTSTSGDFSQSNLNGLSKYDPQPRSTTRSDYIEAINACMNRNRDNNGNNTIDADELRWYVPVSGKYLRLLLGQNSLTSPLMDFNAIKQLPETNNGYNTRYMFLTSDYKVLWAMEGLSVSDYGVYANPPWQIRCIRNLGSNMSNISDIDKVVQAYDVDKVNKIVRLSYYDPMSIRSITYNGNGAAPGQMPVHVINSSYNMPYKAFEYQDVLLNDEKGSPYSPGSSSSEIITSINSNPCSTLNSANKTGWRVPNQKELTILRNSGAITIPTDWQGTTLYFLTSCTMSYFNASGIGETTIGSNHMFMAVRSNATCQLDVNWNSTVRIHCVRDYIE